MCLLEVSLGHGCSQLDVGFAHVSLEDETLSLRFPHREVVSFDQLGTFDSFECRVDEALQPLVSSDSVGTHGPDIRQNLFFQVGVLEVNECYFEDEAFLLDELTGLF